MLYRLIPSAVALILSIAVAAQTSSVQLTVHIPQLPEGRQVFVAGSFNGWKAGDTLYKMTGKDASTFTIVLPVFKNARYLYKYNLGQWSEVEVDASDSNVKNREFVAAGKKTKVRDTVVRWASPKPAAKQISNPRMQQINAMKDSVLAGLQPKLNEMLVLLKEYTLNLLQQTPSAAVDNRITADMVNHFTDAYGRLNGLFHKIFESFTPEQKQQILKAITTPGAEKDFINALGAAVNDVVK